MKIGLFTKRNHIDVDNQMIYAHHWPGKALLIIYKIPVGLGLIRYKFAERLTEGWQIRFFFIIIVI